MTADRNTPASMLTRLGPQLLFLHGYIADVPLAQRLACAPSQPQRPPAAWRRIFALFGWLGCGAIRAFPP